MTCSCPKCHAPIEVELSLIHENGTFMPCPECKGRFWINKESYARMALKKEGALYCDKCGNMLAHSIVCMACGVMYPDYYVVQASKPPRRQVEKPDLFSLSFTLKPAKPTYTYTYSAAKQSGVRSSSILLKRVGLLVLVVLMAVGIGYFYHTKKSEQQFAKNYMRALYVIKSGTELSLNTCAKISTEWKSSMDAGQNYAPHIDSEDESHLSMVKDATDRFMQTLNEPPKKFIGSKEKLANLYGVYSKAQALAIAPSGSLSAFTDSASRSKSDFDSAVQELKRTLPVELSAELKIAQAKYKGLRDI